MALYAKSLTGLTLILICILTLAGCGFTGNVYVFFHWKDADVPDAFSTTIPNVPSDISLLNRSQPYQTLPGTFTVRVDYLPGPVTHVRTVTLESGVAIIGKEDFYYDVFLSSAGINFLTSP